MSRLCGRCAPIARSAARSRRKSQNGVWIGQEPGFDSPFNLGAHCAKGASVREHAHGERRLKYPMKLVNGEWTRLSWEDAVNEIGDTMLQIRAESGTGFGLLAGIGQAFQRTGVPVPQVLCVLGQQQRRPPGPHLPLDDRRRRSQHLGLRRDDQQLQRHPQQPGHFPDRRQSGRGPSGVDAASC